MVDVPMKRAVPANFLLLLTGCILPGPAPLSRFEFTEPRMGTICRVILYAESAERAREGARTAFSELAAVDDRMSDYKKDSELSRLCRAAGRGPQPVTAPLWDVLSAARRFSDLSGGAFDVTVGPAVRLWRRARREGRPPGPAEIEAARSRIGPDLLVLDPDRRTVELRREGMQLDLGGIAKGYGCDRALEALKRLGIRHAMVDTGGGMALGEAPPGKPGWRIQIGEENAGLLILSRCGVATSGDAEQFVVIEGRRYSHIVDPRTGWGIPGPSAVTVVAPDGMTADALATALSVMGPEAGIRLAEELPGVEALFRWKRQDRWEKARTTGFAALLEGG